MSDTPLAPGQTYYSVILELDEEFQRRDIAASHWDGPPEDAVGWWKNVVPMPVEAKRELAPPEVLLDLLRSMGQAPGSVKQRYLLALMLLRRRVLRVVESSSVETNAASPSETAGCETEFLKLVGPDGDVIRVEVVSITKSESEKLKTDLDALLYREEPTKGSGLFVSLEDEN